MDNIFNPKAEEENLASLEKLHAQSTTYPTLPTPELLATGSLSLVPSITNTRSEQDVIRHITSDIVPAITGQALSPRYYGFVTGSSLPIAAWADTLVTRIDQNVQVHLPHQSIATEVEDRALHMLGELLRLGDGFEGRTFTTGATGSNVLGLACGREAIIEKRGGNVGEDGLLGACMAAGIRNIQVLTSGGHSSLSKAASVVGLGRQSVKELGVSADEPWKLDVDAVEAHLQKEGNATIIGISAGEVNTGRFAVDGLAGMKRLRALADKYGAWIHVDGAFGIFARCLDEIAGFEDFKRQAEGIELADSITVDGHKILNVPYDCGMFFTRSQSTLPSVFANPNAAYLAGGSASKISSPLNNGLENSRRFRALPVYATLLSQGQNGFAAMISRMVLLARRIAGWIRASEQYDLLPGGDWDIEKETFIIVLFRARDNKSNENLVEKINATRQMYVSGTKWKGEKAVRIAVSTWKVDVERDGRIVEQILAAVAEGRDFELVQVK
ncbi:L-2 [Emericellopsis cladophorae]|uniref:L-2 n=1 Tax=Emericellopsis cladophorae TaxID=2686198 RepID=A0A9P9Y4W2_9HYPO|nr:L-2 [Emericellopsis cladophorae]KAI6783536.1 L-2 [Emericellopsis cladophorae]